MATYKMDHLEPHGLVAKTRLFEAADDLEALQVAEALNNAQGYELWQRSRLVRQVLTSQGT